MPFTADIDQAWAELGVGADLTLSPNATLYGHVGYEVTLDGEAPLATTVVSEDAPAAAYVLVFPGEGP